MKKLLVFLAATLLVSSLQPVYAVVPTGLERREAGEAKLTQIQERTATIQTNTMTRLRDKADKEIDRRIAALTKLIDKVNAVKHITEAQKSTIVTGIQAQITSLTALKAKIDGDTDLATLRTDVQSIVSSYRIYALYIPEITIIANADKMLNLMTGEIAALTAKLQLRITEASANGFDVTTLNSYMSQRSTKLADALAQANSAISKVTVLTPAGWPGNKTELQTARDLLQTARKNLNDAQKFASQVRVGLKGMNPTGAPKPTKTPTPVPTSTPTP